MAGRFFFVRGCYKDIEYMMIYLDGAASDCGFHFWHKCCKEKLALKEYICKNNLCRMAPDFYQCG